MTMVPFGPEQLTVIMNGHEVQGWAPVADFFMPPQATEFYTSRTGPKGDKFFYRQGMSRGGEVKIVLMPNSPTVDFFDQQVQIVNQGGQVMWNGSARNRANGKSQTFERGVLKTAAKGDQFGAETVADKTYIFEFETII